MTGAPRNRAWVALGIVLSIAFAVLAHAAIVDEVPRTLGALLSLVPVALVAFFAARRARHRTLAFAALALAAAALAAMWSGVERHFTDLFFVEHAGTNLALAFLFGRTLLPGSEPLCARFARLIHGELPPEVVRYTRQVTIAWTVFFVVLFALSAGLYLGGWREAWSMLANFITAGAVGAMFLVEYAIRMRVLPNWEREGLMVGVHAFRRHFEQSRAGAPR